MNYQSLIERKLTPQGSSGNDILYICPNPQCDDNSGHLYVDYDKGKYHCFKCDIGGNRLTGLLKLLNISVDFDYDSLEEVSDASLDEIISMKKDKSKKSDTIVDYSSDLQVLTSYYVQHIKPLSPIAYNYLRNRGISDDMINRLKLCEGISRYNEDIILNGKTYKGRDYSGRIMIPSMRRDGTISFYLGRDYTGSKPNKYSNAPKELGVASEDVWSLDIIESDSVIICEGAFTATAVNNALGKIIACATYGKSIAQRSSERGVRVTSQGEKLLARKFKSYIMFYDKDALYEAYKNAQYLYDRGARVSVVKIPDDMYGEHADAGDMTNKEIIDLILNSELYDLLSSNVISGLM